jgi:peroxiredoxin
MKKRLFLFLLLAAFSFLSFTKLEADEVVAAPDFSLPDLSGSSVTLSAYKNNKQSVLLLFWTSACPYCLREMKILNAKQGNLREKGIELLAINAGESKTRVERLVNNYNLDLRVLLDENTEVSYAYGVLGVPTFVLIDSKGNVVFIDNYYPGDEIKDLALK